MIFKRRTPPTFLERVRVLVWPRHTWERSLKYIALRLMRVRATPHQLALGFAVGVFAAITPLVGIQMLIAGVITLALRASFTAAMLGTFFGNPLTWAIVWPATYATGSFLLGIPAATKTADLAQQLSLFWDTVWQLSPEMILAALGLAWPYMKPMLIGTLPVGAVIATVCYIFCKRAAHAHQQRRRRLSPQGSGYPLGDLLATYDPEYS
ncbi:conserved membrane protein of unknown function [Candidatus Filomicrobium marinum]|uniref:DUF2062 domain-containing protein n=1 Tax=Candidatus Filomicrobium marinum TaxID=1608628 RepID=A0A0D6JIE2_9HYPH|nr:MULTISPECIES: DUF2062 domain-containing protein [Filomicrobium]MCV0369424.1 DUF2062 domain-containing protein [Filomicrobium sp.]CFX42320.1 conserved membrane protein of unknown function [Candidatus Filomicrobium marinum]CPR21094.1 conserved membrane protein of unknown function [Candidatus Filomicrobium marinum]